MKAGTVVISRMGLVHQVASIDSLGRSITLNDGRTFDALDFCVYEPENHGALATLETCAECHVTGAAQ